MSSSVILSSHLKFTKSNFCTMLNPDKFASIVNHLYITTFFISFTLITHVFIICFYFLAGLCHPTAKPSLSFHTFLGHTFTLIPVSVSIASKAKIGKV